MDRFNKHADLYHLLPPRQSSYRLFHSTKTAITIIHNDIVRAIDAGEVSVLVLLDLGAAFDTVDHDVLLDVFQKRFRVECCALDWFRSYLSNRTQSFCITSGQSALVSLPCSVPQGSRIGPQEFIVYTEDITETIADFSLNHHLEHLRRRHAAPKELTYCGHKNNLELCVAAITHWCSSRRLQLNADKTELIWFGPRSNQKKLMQAETNLYLGSTIIEPAAIVRNLGV